MDGLVFAESLYACRRPYFLLVQKVGKDTPEGGKIQNLSPPSGLPPHSNWSRSGLLDNSPRVRTSVLLSYLSLFVTFLPDMFVSFVSFIRYTIRLRKIENCSGQELRQAKRRTQAGLTPGKDDNDVWLNSCRNRLKVSMGA